MNTLFWFPGYAFLPALALLAVLSAVRKRPLARFVQTPAFLWWGSVLAGAYLAEFLDLSCYHLASAGYGEQHSEGFAIKGLLILLGKPLYTDVYHSAERYSLLHGPNASLLFAAVMAVIGRTLFACKFAVFLGNVCTGIFTWLAFRRRCSRPWAFVVTVLALCPFLLIHAPAFITIRPDAFVNTLVALALWRVTSGKRLEQLLVLAAATALAMNLKINTVVCFFPLLFLIAWPYRAWEWLLAFAVGAVVLALPFAWPTVSFWNYVAWIRASSHLDAGDNELPGAIHWFLLLGVPLVLGVWIMARRGADGKRYLLSRTALFTGGAFLSLLAMTISATRQGASPSYFVPLLPVIFYAYLLLGGEVSGVLAAPSADGTGAREVRPGAEWLLVFAGAVVLAWTITGMDCAKDIFLDWQNENAGSATVYADVDRIVAALPGKSIAIGYGTTATFFVANHRFRLVAAGQPYFLDATSLMSTNQAQIPLPAATSEMIARKTVQIWLIPRGEEPFTIRNYYPPHDRLFDPAFAFTFRDHYHLIGNSGLFDCYEANP